MTEIHREQFRAIQDITGRALTAENADLVMCVAQYSTLILIYAMNYAKDGEVDPALRSRTARILENIHRTLGEDLQKYRQQN